MTDDKTEFEEPDCDYDERSRPGYVRIRLQIPGIEPHAASVFNKMLLNIPKAKNAKFVGPIIDIRSYSLQIIGQSDLSKQKYAFSVKQLPFDIIPHKCTFELQKDWVYIFLKKKDKDQSWERYIQRGTLETDE